MRRLLLAGALALTAALFVVPAWAGDDDDADEGDKRFSIHGEVRSRWEYFDNVADFLDHSDSGDFEDDEYDIWPFRVRIAAEGHFTDNVKGYIELQNSGFFGNETPFKALPDPNFQVLGTGGVPRGFPGFEEEDTSLYQGWVALEGIAGSSFDLKIGRQEHVLGNELQLGDLDFYSGLSFDGLRGTFNWEKSDLNLFYYLISELGAGCTAFCSNENFSLAGATWTWQINNKGQVLEPYLLDTHNSSDFNPVFFDRMNIWTYGARYSRPVMSSEDIDDGHFDWNAEVALQNGDIGFLGAEEDHKASIVEGWFGYNWKHGNSRSRAHIGLLTTSGDDDQSDDVLGNEDSDHEDYLFLFTDVHANNRLGDMDLETFFFSWADTVFGPFFANGITDLSLGYTWHGEDDRHRLMGAVHNFVLSEDFCGIKGTRGGPTTSCDDELGLEADFSYNFRYTEHVALEAGLAWFSPGTVVDGVFGEDTDGSGLPDDADEAMRVWGQARLRW